MEAKAVTSGMTAMSRRSREHRSSKTVGTIQEISASQSDIASSSKNFKGVVNKYAAPSSVKPPAEVGVASEVLKSLASVETCQGFNSLVQQPHAVTSNDASTLLGSGCSSGAAWLSKGRPLRGRPRGRHFTPAKKIARRAKRLQEVPLSEGDGARILGRRIKLFWRDEKRWFYGVVKAFNRGRRSHKIVYDDKEEEWVKLHEEIFKLQVLEGEVFGTQQQDVARQSAEVTCIDPMIVGKGENINQQGCLDKDIVGSTNGGIQTSILKNNSRVLSNLLRASESCLELPGVCLDLEYRDQRSSIREDGFNARAVEESEDAVPMICESLDLEDPYAIDHTSISDSLVMFMRSKQSFAELSKTSAASGVISPSQSAAVAARSTEVLSGVESLVGNLEVSPSSPDASGIFADHLTLEGCASGERSAPEGPPFEDKKGSINFKSIESAKGGDVDSTVESEKRNVLDTTETNNGCGLHTIGNGKGECASCENTESGQVDLASVDVIVCVSGKEECASLERRENLAQNASNDITELGNRVVQCFVCKDADPYLATVDSMKCLSSKFKSVTRSLAGSKICKVQQPYATRVIRTTWFISRHIATNLVHLECIVFWRHLSSWRPDVGNIWRCVPYLMLFVDVVLESDSFIEILPTAHVTYRSGDISAKRLSWERDSLSGFDSKKCADLGLSCPSPNLATAKFVLHGARTSLDVSNWELLLQQVSHLEVSRKYVEANPPSSESPCSKVAPPFPEPYESVIVEKNCVSMVVEPLCEPMLVEQPVSVAVLPVLEDLDRGGERSHQVVSVETNNGSYPRNDEVDDSEFRPAEPRTHCAEIDVVRDTSVEDEAGSGELTEVQIGSAVEGEEDSTIACWRSWASVKRGYPQITPDELGSYDTGAVCRLQGLLDSELCSMSLTKRQKIHVESLSTIDLQTENEDGGKDSSVLECEVNGDRKTRSVDMRDCDSALPRVNVFKLRKCSTGKGGWRVAGNSCVSDRTVRQSGDGGESLILSSIADRKRSFNQCFEFNQSEKSEENGHPGWFTEGSHVDRQEMSNVGGADEVKLSVKGMWSNCEVSSVNEATFNPRKRFKNGSISSGSSDDSDLPRSRTEERFPNRNRSDCIYPDSVCRGCIANVLVVQHDRGWREYGASVELQSCHGQGWMLIISVRGENMYAYKAEQAIVTGTANRHSHAIVWKGEKGWNLEFEDKKHWQSFKDLHEECYRRNAKASSGRQIPIPGVRHIEDVTPRGPGCPFTRPYSRYICGAGDEVEMALGNSRVVYDMDSEDEQWLEQINTERENARGTLARPLIAEDTLERLLDKLEKEAYLHQQEHKGMNLDYSDVAAESCSGLATHEVIKVIYSYWLDKRSRKGMPLVRHFQPPAWVQHQKLLQLWEQEIARLQLQRPSATMQQLAEEMKKPPLFAFCLRPRGLEAQHKLSKQKSHRKYTSLGTAPRQSVGFGSLDSSLDSPCGRQYYTEPAHRLLPAPRRPGRPRLTEEVAANLTGPFNAVMRELGVPSEAMPSMQFRDEAFDAYAHRRVGKHKKVGRKARRQRLIAAAQESRRKRLLMRNVGSGGLHQQSDLALAAARARSIAEAARARAQALYGVADAAMHKAVAAVIAADALHAVQHQEEDDKPLAQAGNLAVIATFGSWHSGDSGSAPRDLESKRSASQQGPDSDGEDALLPVASWSQELGAGLGTRLLNNDARMEGIISTRSVHVGSPPLNVGFGRTRESMVAMMTR
nr:uncharacterized protein LOC112288421 isoform X1 [Physcomitrium patens]|eukprot:XP_024388338.1 uncharacterized protein LOC112288421 isoform X1 [Physcomitrella patens]